MAKKNKSVRVVPAAQMFQSPTADGGERFTTACNQMRQKMLAQVPCGIRSRMESQIMRMTRSQLEAFEAALVERALPIEDTSCDMPVAFTVVELGDQRIDPIDAWIAMQAA